MRAIPFLALAACSSSYAPTDAALDALASGGGVTVTQDEWIVFTPDDPVDGPGFIFYPGGKVAPEAYAAPVRRVAEAGHLAVIVPMPRDLAIFGAGRAMDVIEAHPGPEGWVMGGHSLGGVAAAGFAAENPDLIEGLALWAAWPQDKHDLSESTLRVTSIYGSADGLATPEEVLASAPLLPPDAAFVEIVGGNHAQFGDYGAQEDDGVATLGVEDQQAQVVAATLAVF